ncbi:MAG: glycosyltransferase family 1 protein [Chryseobacterium sp. 39-10]|nr:MAG: glycosyltransferase family 1 protein [Chryseobacterium sp. 39-10]
MKKKLIRITTVPLSLDKLLGKQLSFMNCYFEVIAVSSDGPYLKRVAEKLGVRFNLVEMTRTISPVQDLKSLWHFYRLCKKEKPQIVHSHTPKAGIVGMLGAKLAGVPVRMHTVAGLPLMEAKGIKRRMLDGVEKLTYRCATHVYPNSRGLYEFILQNNFTAKDKLEVIGNGSSNGIDTEYFSPTQIAEEQKVQLKKELGIHEKDFVFLFVGRLVGDKGINELINAFHSLKTAESNNKQYGTQRGYKLLLVGPLESHLDPLHPETLKKIEQHPHIIMTGFQQEVRPFLAISNCLVFPSYREGFPNVVLQAGAMELPSIVSDINGCNEIIVNGKNGLIIPSKNTKAVEEAMQKVMDDRELYRQLRENARPMIKSRYEQSVVWNALLEEYGRVAP